MIKCNNNYHLPQYYNTIVHNEKQCTSFFFYFQHLVRQNELGVTCMGDSISLGVGISTECHAPA
jgi:hypothetical protein